MTIWTNALAHNDGDRIAAGVEIAAALMQGDPETFKQGYTAPNALIAVADLAARNGAPLTNEEQSAIRARIHEPVGELPEDIIRERIGGRVDPLEGSDL